MQEVKQLYVEYNELLRQQQEIIEQFDSFQTIVKECECAREELELVEESDVVYRIEGLLLKKTTKNDGLAHLKERLDFSYVELNTLKTKKDQQQQKLLELTTRLKKLTDNTQVIKQK